MMKNTLTWETDVTEGRIKIVRHTDLDGSTVFDYTGTDGVTQHGLKNWLSCMPLLKRDGYQGDFPDIFLNIPNGRRNAMAGPVEIPESWMR